MWESDEESSAEANDTDDQLVVRKGKGNRAKRGMNSMPRNVKRAQTENNR